MKLYKTIRVIGTLFLATMLLASCDKENAAKETEVLLSAHVSSLGSGTGLWGQVAEIGVFALETGSSKIYEEINNLKYNATITTGIFTLSPSDKALIIKNNGSIIDVVAYYPYSSKLETQGASKHICKLDMSDQSDLKPGMFMTAKVKSVNSVNRSATLALTPVIAKLGISLVIRTTKAESREPAVFIDGIAATADVDVITGTYTSYGPAETVQLSMADHSIYYYEALLPAQELTDETVLKVSQPDQSQEEAASLYLKEYISQFESNRQYDLEVVVSPEGLKASLVQVSDLNVTNWKEDSEHIDGNTD